MLCKILEFHGCDYEKWRLLGCYTVWLLLKPTFSEERIDNFIKATKIGELGTTSAVSSSRSTVRRNVTLVMEAIRSLETLVLT
jgi:hypothetical protein